MDGYRQSRTVRYGTTGTGRKLIGEKENIPTMAGESTRKTSTDFLPVTILAILLFVLVPFERLTHIHPIYVCFAILFILYPFRQNRSISQMFAFAILIALISFWIEFSTLLMPFVFSFGIAFFLDPLMKKLEARSIPRWVVMLIFFFIVLGGITLIAFFLMPQIISESRTLFNALPGWITIMSETAENRVMPLIGKFQLWKSGNDSTEAVKSISQYSHQLINWLTDWSSGALQGVGKILTSIANIALIPIIAAYMVADFKKMKTGIYNAVPAKYQGYASDAFKELNIVLSAYVRGQLIVVLFLATWISLGLSIFTDIPYAILIGTTAGILTLIPYIGPIIAQILAIVVAAFQPDPWLTIVIVVAVFVSAQMIEGNFLTPRIVGTRVGLSELEVIFLMLLFGSMLGLVGMLIAIPAGASAKVLFKVYRQHRIA